MKSAMDKLIKKYFIVSIISFFMVLVITGTASYALFQIDKENTTNQNISVGNLSASLTSIEGAVVLKDLYPELSTNLPEDYKTYNFTVSNDGDYDLKYEIYLKDTTSELLSKENEYSSYKQINPEYYKYINFVLDDGELRNLANTLDNGKFMLLKGKMEPGYSKEHKIKFFIDDGETTSEGAPNDLQNSLLALDIYLDAVAYDKKLSKTLTLELLSKANDMSITDYNSGVKGEMFAFTHPEAEQTTGWSEEERTDYRYIGNVPNNYIKFNDEIWRIMGVFTVEGLNGERERRIKIMRDESIGTGAWNTELKSEWVGSSMQTRLNGDYYNRTNSYSELGLNFNARSQIKPVLWHLGAHKVIRNNTTRAISYSQILDGKELFASERSLKTCATEETCEGETRSTSVINNVGLMYVSDYSFTFSNNVDNICFTDGMNCSSGGGGNPEASWLYSKDGWTITPASDTNRFAFYIYPNGSLGLPRMVTIDSYKIYPVVYLRSDINFKSGDGASPETAYVLE